VRCKTEIGPDPPGREGVSDGLSAFGRPFIDCAFAGGFGCLVTLDVDAVLFEVVGRFAAILSRSHGASFQRVLHCD